MQCRCCRSLMVQVRSQNNSSSRQEWHECPVCHRVSMSSTPQREMEMTTRRRSIESDNNSLRRAI